MQADWLTNLSIAKLPANLFYVGWRTFSITTPAASAISFAAQIPSLPL